MKTFLTILLFFTASLLHAQNVFVSASGSDDGPALNSACGTPGRTVNMTVGTYHTSQIVYVAPGVTILGNGSTVIPSSTFPTGLKGVFMTKTIVEKQASVSISVDSASYTFTYSGASTLKVGSILTLYGGVYYTRNSDSYSYGWFSRIAGISGTTVTMEDKAPATFTATSLTQRKPNTNIHIKDLHILSVPRIGGFAIDMPYCTNSSIEGCYAESSTTGGLLQGLRIMGLDNIIKNCLVNKMDLSHPGSDGPAFHLEGHRDTVFNCRSFNTQSGPSSAGRNFISTGLVFMNNEIVKSGGWTGADFHANASGKIINNKIWMPGGGHATHARRWNTIVEGNISYFTVGGYMVYQFELGYKNMTIQNNTGYYTGTLPKTVVRNAEMPAQINYVNVNNVLIAGSIPAYPPVAIPGSSDPGTPPVVIVTPPSPGGLDTTCCYIKVLWNKQ